MLFVILQLTGVQNHLKLTVELWRLPEGEQARQPVTPVKMASFCSETT